MHEAKHWINTLSLIKHPEGGYYRETYRSEDIVTPPEHYHGKRNACTLIYYLLESHDMSALHRFTADEIWHFYAGSPITIHELLSDGTHKTTVLGDTHNMLYHYIIPGNTWFGAQVNEPDSYTLIGCTVSPGFEFSDFALGKRENLVKQYPRHQTIIEALTRKANINR